MYDPQCINVSTGFELTLSNRDSCGVVSGLLSDAGVANGNPAESECAEKCLEAIVANDDPAEVGAAEMCLEATFVSDGRSEHDGCEIVSEEREDDPERCSVANIANDGAAIVAAEFTDPKICGAADFADDMFSKFAGCETEVPEPE